MTAGFALREAGAHEYTDLGFLIASIVLIMSGPYAVPWVVIVPTKADGYPDRYTQPSTTLFSAAAFTTCRT